MDKYITIAPDGQRCISLDDAKELLGDRFEEFMSWVKGQECIGIVNDGKTTVAIPLKTYIKFPN